MAKFQADRVEHRPAKKPPGLFAHIERRSPGRGDHDRCNRAVQIWTLRSVILGGFSQGTTMRGLVIVGVLCLTSMPALACVFDTDCKPGFSCRNGACSGIEMNSGDVKPSVPKERVKGAKYCTYDSDCIEGSRCIKGSLLEGVCLGR